MAKSQAALLRSLLKRLVLVLAVWFVLHSVFITVDGMSQPQRTADVAVVLGTTVHPSGKVTPWLEARLQRAVELYRQNQVQNIMVSGATGIGIGSVVCAAQRVYHCGWHEPAATHG